VSGVELVGALSEAQLDELADLERRTLSVDGGRLKLEWGTLHSAVPGDPPHALARDSDGRLVGFLGSYAFGGDTVELAGSVDPALRRRGVGTDLLDAVLPQCAGRPQVLLVVPRNSTGGSVLARLRGGRLAHSEHSLVLDGCPAPGPGDPRLQLRAADADDVEAVARLLAAGFGGSPADLADRAAARLATTLVAERDGVVIGVLRAELTGQEGGVYGFTVEPSQRGLGIGRHVLRRTCQMLRAHGAVRVGLEVATDNESALGLYTSLGFKPVSVEDYWDLAPVT
jgi:ribosomal protein S18 acetylase RimI-like enzyme